VKDPPILPASTDATLSRDPSKPASKNRRKLWRALGFFALLPLGATAWYLWAVEQGVYLLQATAEAHGLCIRLIGELECPAVAELPADPWGRSYVCDRSKDGEFVVRTFGRDGRPGGLDNQSDIACRSTDESCSCEVRHEPHPR
jgi:hypothetical protein